MILILGGLGFVGSNTALALLDAGEDCVLTQYRNDHVPAPLQSQVGKRVFIEPLDVMDMDALLAIGEKHKITGIVHLLTGGGVHLGPDATATDLAKDIHDTTTAVANVLQAAKTWGAKRVTLASAPVVYNGIAELPWREDQPLPMTAGFGIEAAKKTMELVSSFIGAQTGLECVVLRLPAMYGPFYDPSRAALAARLVHAAVKGEKINVADIAYGSAYAADGMDQCYIKDAARGIALLHTTKKLNHHAYNIASGHATTNQQVVDAIKKVIPEFEVELSAGHMPGSPETSPYQDITWLHEDTGYEPRFDIDSGIADYIAWLRAGNER